MLKTLALSLALVGAVALSACQSSQTTVARADALVAEIMAALERPVTDEGRLAAAEALAQLDAMGPEVLTQKSEGYNRMVSLNRGIKNPDEAILRRFMDLYDQLDPADRGPFRFGRYLAYETLAAQAHREDDFEGEKALIREGLRVFAADPEATREPGILQQLLDRAELVGKPAPSLVADHWLNVAPPDGQLAMGGNVTIIEFTAHWCSPCIESYPALLQLHERFAERGLRVVLATQLWGYFGEDKDLSADAEIEADRKSFLEDYKLPFPIAISNALAGAGSADAADPNTEAYFVQPIPQFIVVDQQGVIRQVDLGWDEEIGARLEATIERLLDETSAGPEGPALRSHPPGLKDRLSEAIRRT